MEKPRKELTPIGDIISGLLTDGTLPFNADDVDIWKVWDEVVGESFLGNTRPSRIRNRNLTVMCLTPSPFRNSNFRRAMSGKN